MNYIIKFDVGLEHNGYQAGDVCLRDPSQFARLKGVATGFTPLNEFMYCINMEASDPKLQHVFEILETETGRRPLADLVYQSVKRPRDRFVVKVDRIPSEEELEESRWLYLVVPKLKIADAKNVQSEPDGSYVIGRVTSKRKIAFGHASWHGWMMLFSDALKDLLLSTELTPVEFRPVKLKNGSLSGLWQIHSPMQMPPLAMNLIDSKCQPFVGDPSKGCLISDGYYYPDVLRYRESDVASLPAFDLALSRECIGKTDRRFIVSQRFRQVADKLAPGQFNYGLVAVGEGEELRTRYTIPELAPPLDAV